MNLTVLFKNRTFAINKDNGISDNKKCDML